MIRLLVTSGRGPVECRIAVAKAIDALTIHATDSGLDVDCVEGPNADGHGPASAILVIHGVGSEAFARSWIGSIQWIAQSPLRPHHKRKNWFISVVELAPPQAIPTAVAPHDVRFETFRAGGPGGQHQNKTESAVRAVHVASGLVVVAREERSQQRNKGLALLRLSALVKLRADLAAVTARHDTHAAHQRVERGRPVKCFTGSDFRPTPI